MALRVGYIGLGDMGAPMAARLPAAGFALRVFDLLPARVEALLHTGAQAAASVREAAADCDWLCLCVPGEAELRSALMEAGALSALRPGAAVLIHSTVLPEAVQWVAEAAEARGCGVLDACVTGGAARAQRGALTFLVGGEAALLERARPLLEASAERILHAGPLGSGAKLKLALNTLTYIQWAAAYESFHLARAAGLDPALLIEAGRANGQLSELQRGYLALHQAPGESAASEDFQRAVRGHRDIAAKDLAHALELARRNGLALPNAELVSRQLARLYRVAEPGESAGG